MLHIESRSKEEPSDVRHHPIDRMNCASGNLWRMTSTEAADDRKNLLSRLLFSIPPRIQFLQVLHLLNR